MALYLEGLLLLGARGRWGLLERLLTSHRAFEALHGWRVVRTAVRVDIVRFEVVAIDEATLCWVKIGTAIGVPSRLAEVGCEGRVGHQTTSTPDLFSSQQDSLSFIFIFIHGSPINERASL